MFLPPLPCPTAAQTKSFRLMAALSSGLRSPELPMQVLQLAFERDAHRHRKTAQVGKSPGQPQQRIAATNLAANRGEGIEGCGKSVGPGGRRGWHGFESSDMERIGLNGHGENSVSPNRLTTLAAVLLCVNTQTSGFGGTNNSQSTNWITAVSHVSTACWPHVGKRVKSDGKNKRTH